jgi:hypothetical protein
MISRNSEGGFFAAHWDWIAAGVGVVALAVGGVMFMMSGGTDPDENADGSVKRLMTDKKSETGVKPVEMASFERALQLASKPPVVPEVSEDGGSFLVSPRRIFCALCHKPIPGDATKCPICKGDQPEPEKVALDTDSDGLPDDWEKKFGLDAATADADTDTDADGFTNAEEFAAGTDPSDKNSHPDYFDSLKLVMPLKETMLPFFFEKAEQLPGGKTRFYFRDPKAKNAYGGRGLQYNPLEGEEIGNTGFVVKGVERKSMKVKVATVKGEKALERTKEVAVATVERKSDGKTLQLPDGEKRIPVDIQATLSFSRGEPREVVAVPGTTFKLYGATYKVVEIKSAGKGAKVSIEDPHGKIRSLETVDQ